MLDTFFITIFWLTFLLCLASYAFYPLLLAAARRVFPLQVLQKREEPSVSLLIAAYNEERDIAGKIASSLALDYPPDKLEILIGSDGSSDGTVATAEAHAGGRVQVLAYPENRGKTSVQNDLVQASSGEILVFTDAASNMKPDAIRKLVRNFADPRVGCVAGCMRFVNTDANINTQSQGFYWRYELMLRKLESSVGSLIGVDGPLYAVRRKNYVPLVPQAISDLLTPLLVLGQGLKVVLEPEAIIEEDPTRCAGDEFRTRRRITLRGLTGLKTYRQLLNPLRHLLLSLQIVLHKLLRWFVGPLVLLHLLACAALGNSPFFSTVGKLYVLFFLAAFAGWLLERRGGKNRLLSVPYYFSLVNLAATAGIVDFFRRRDATSWKPVRH